MKAKHALLYAALLGLAGWSLNACGRSPRDPEQQIGANPAPIPARGPRFAAMARGLKNLRMPVTGTIDGKGALPIAEDVGGVIWRVSAGQQ
jgi:hypothetical protein